MSASKMTALEWRAIISLSTIMSLRLLGLFMVLPIFTLYAEGLPGATPTLIGVAVGIYGLFQALCQLPFGAMSDHLGRKPIILMGLFFFIIGSVIAGFANTMSMMIIGRALQGAGAIGSTTLAMMADLTREEQRTTSMAIAGISMGFSFSLAMLLGPLLMTWLSVADIFFLAAFFGVIAILILYRLVPTPQTERWHRDTEPEWRSFLALLVSPQLAKLNIGIFILHAIFTASFVVIPISLHQFIHLAANQQWQLYLPALLAAFIVVFICIRRAEQNQQLKFYFLGSILTLTAAELLLWLAPSHVLLTVFSLCLFFAGFSLLEAFLPSLISRTAPAARKGSALGIFSCAQFFGIFVGGVLGGWLYGQYSFSGVFLFCITLSCFWLALALLMQPPRYLVTQILRLLPEHQKNWEALAAKLHVIPGMVEVTFIAEDGVAYLKMERGTKQHPDLIRLKEQIQSE
jgi:MFS family permease